MTERAISYLSDNGIDAVLDNHVLTVFVETKEEIGPMAKTLKKLLAECGYTKSWGVRVIDNPVSN